MALDRAGRIHLIGIGGTGLSAIARLLLERGWKVTGSDRLLSPLAEGLREAGVPVMIGHRAENVLGASLVVRSSAIPDDNVEVLAARQAGIPVVKRNEFLGDLMAEQEVVAVAGTHGKTTTTSMLAWILTAMGQDPSYIIGGVPVNLGVNAHAGKGPVFVIEADEYDRMFVGLKPSIAVVTTVEHDHPDYYPTPADFFQAFTDFVHCIRPGGLLLGCKDDPGAANLITEARSAGIRTLAYGIDSPDLDYQAENLSVNPQGGFSFDVRCYLPGGLGEKRTVGLQVPGRHNVLNALAALAVAHQLGLSTLQAGLALGTFGGSGRRFEVRGQAAGVVVIDDYAHHPTEIRATLAAARVRFPGHRIWAVWQPHTYSRTRTLLREFAGAFEQADQVIITDIYPAREVPPQDGFGCQNVMAAFSRPNVHLVPDLAQVTTFLLEQLYRGDVLLVMSAGDADLVSANVLAALQERSTSHA
jgi:UDP-N-acetylmuramate--alanine ligase